MLTRLRAKDPAPIVPMLAEDRRVERVATVALGGSGGSSDLNNKAGGRLSLPDDVTYAVAAVGIRLNSDPHFISGDLDEKHSVAQTVTSNGGHHTATNVHGTKSVWHSRALKYLLIFLCVRVRVQAW